MIHYQDDRVTLHHGDCLDVLRADELGYDYRLGYFPPAMPDASVDSVVTDPPYGLEFMGKEWDGADGFRRSLNPNDSGRDNVFGRASRTSPEYRALHTFQQWCELWAAECLRVLKPGGHLLAFGGTRTWHRLACAVEDAGFEVRDSIAWLYGSGFPKSLDVSKAIDKAAGAEREVVGAGSAGRSALGNQSRVEQGYRPTVIDGSSFDITAPATPDAERWQGWGTALKPAFEPVVVARKPLASPDVNVLGMVESELRNRLGIKEIRWTNGPASGAAKRDPQTNSSSTEAPPVVATSAAPADASETLSAARPTANGSGLSIEPGPRPTASTSGRTTASRTGNSETRSSTPMAESVPAATSDSTSSSPSTTSTEAAPHTGSPSTARSTPNSGARDSHPATESFAGIATGLTGSRTHAHIKRLPDGSFVWPDGLPKFVKGGPLTVAGNVLTHGTGALNIDGCRIAGERITTTNGSVNEIYGDLTYNAGQPWESHTAGRWPANVVLDETQADALDEQSGHQRDGVAVNRNRGDERPMEVAGAPRKVLPVDHGHGGEGGASRFFYVAKADATERPRVNGTAHPTVKPLNLMRWLVRLVTPPGGTVLEPFAGSGTTVEACIVERFHCIAIEREADYLPLIEARIARRRDPVRAIELNGEDMGLFGIEEVS